MIASGRHATAQTTIQVRRWATLTAGIDESGGEAVAAR
jgi:hypothetical protein